VGNGSGPFVAWAWSLGGGAGSVQDAGDGADVHVQGDAVVGAAGHAGYVGGVELPGEQGGGAEHVPQAVPAQRIDPLGPVPPYLQIAAIIKRGILSGQYPPDTRIPTESELVETYEVARSTARRAVAALREEGLVYTVQARGTYVARLDGETR
jgi:GntR family transcriptional regulator